MDDLQEIALTENQRHWGSNTFRPAKQASHGIVAYASEHGLDVKAHVRG